MAIPELEKLAIGERSEFLRLYHTAPHDLSRSDEARLEYFAGIVDFGKHAYELNRVMASNNQAATLEIVRRNPFIIETFYGVLILPDDLAPEPLWQLPSAEYCSNFVEAIFSANLDTKLITSFMFKGYLKNVTQKELTRIPGLDSAPNGNWPRL